VLIRGAFANIRLRNKVCAPLEGGLTKHFPSGDVLSIYEAANRYIAGRVPTVVIAGKEYGSGSSRDWAAKGPAALGVRVIIAESIERIHRSNLVGMGIVPLEFPPGVNAETLGLDGTEVIDVEGLHLDMPPRSSVRCTIHRSGGASETIDLRCRLDTRREIAWYLAGGILNYVFEQIRKK
jgi:aconitate hydratase